MSARLVAIKSRVETLRDAVSREEGRQAEVNDLIVALTDEYAEAQQETDEIAMSVEMLQRLEGVYQAKFQANVARIISRGLTAVFGERMELLLKTRVSRDVTTVEFKLVQDYGKHGDTLETNVIGAKGGTVVVLLNVLMRILLVMSAHPPMRRFLELDEPFGQADVDMIPAFGELLHELAGKLGFQIMLVTHEKVLVDIGDTAYQVYAQPRNAGSAFEQLHARNERVV